MEPYTTRPAREGCALADSPAGIARMFELAPNFMAMVQGPDHRFLHANPAYLRLVGRPDVVGLTVREAFPEIVSQGFIDILDGVYATGEPFTAEEMPVSLARGAVLEQRYASFVYQPTRDAEGNIVGLMAHGVDVTAQVQARKKLEERETWYRSLIEHSDDKMSVLKADGTTIYESAALSRLLGWQSEEVIGRPMAEFVHGDDVARVMAHLGMALASPGTAHRLELRLLHRDGSWQHFEAVGHARPGSDGPEVVVNCRDITEAMRAREELRERESYFRALVELIPQLVWTARPDGHHDYFNRRWYEYIGEGPGGGQGWSWMDYLHPDDHARTRELWQHSLDTGAPYAIEYRFRRESDGEYRWFIARALPLRDEAGAILRWFGTCTDVHGERMALEKARSSEARFIAVAEATSDVVWDLNLRTGHVWRNDNLEQVLRYGSDRMAPTREAWAAVVHPADRERVVTSVQRAIRERHDLWTEEYRMIRGDGSIASVMDRGRLVLDADGTPIRIVGSVIDLTERNRLEAELQLSHKLEAVGRLAGGIAHDFNNLLTIITSYTEMLLEDLPVGSMGRAEIDEIGRAAGRASTLTRQMLAFSGRQVLQPRPLDLNDVVAGIEEMLRKGIGERIRFDFQPAADAGPVLADRGQVEQVIMNLALNARDAMPGGGSLTISTGAVHEDGRACTLLAIGDTGAGMDDETLARAFEPFFTTKPLGQGTGLGLSTVHGIITQSGGRIEVTTAPGAGTTFRILLPVTTKPLPAISGEQPPATPRPVRPATVLIVEDEAAVRAIICRSLARKGYEVHQAESGASALRLLAGGLTVDLVITDLVMPGIGGQELAREVRSRGLDAPVLFMSGYAGGNVPADHAIPADAVLLEKPFTIVQLLRAVETALGEATFTPAPATTGG